ncbi:hypothetical protein RCO25_21790 [Paenibacillus sp. LHD-38]|nr:hypothetical protein [Paenibacillus sp. LHD-38]MDQ8737101.1 hypothetical protein [Paenibacillus sp. LHD-38]
MAVANLCPATKISDLAVQHNLSDHYEWIPDSLKLRREMNLPPAMMEHELRRHIDGLLAKNKHGAAYLNFLGAGCWQHFIPAICDEVNQRSEFVTAYAGEPYEDHGRFQSLFEYQSLMAELVDMDVVNVPTFDWAQAASTAIRMAGRITGRTVALLPKSVDPDKVMIIHNYCTPVMELQFVEIDAMTGRIDLDDLRSKLSSETAAVYFENPGYGEGLGYGHGKCMACDGSGLIECAQCDTTGKVSLFRWMNLKKAE